MKKLRFVTTAFSIAATTAIFPFVTNCGPDTDDKVKVTLEVQDKIFYKDSIYIVKDKFYEFTINYTANLWDHDGKLFYVSDASHSGPIALIDAQTIYGNDSDGELVFEVSGAQPGAAVVDFSKGAEGCTKNQTIKIYCKFTSNMDNASIIFG